MVFISDMGASDPKCGNSNYTLHGGNSLRLEGLYTVSFVYIFGFIINIKNKKGSSIGSNGSCCWKSRKKNFNFLRIYLI